MKKIIILCLCLVTVLTLTLSSTIAYLTDTDSQVNVMVVGNIDIELIELERKDALGSNDVNNLREFSDDKPLYPAYYENLGWDDDWQDWPAGGSSALFSDEVQTVLDKFVFVKNTGSSDAYTRVWFAFEQSNLSEAEFEAAIGQNINDTHWNWETVASNVEIDGGKFLLKVATYTGNAGEDGLTHKDGVLGPGETTRPSLLQVMMYNHVDNAEVQALDANGDGKFNILVVSQAAQTTNFPDAVTGLNAAFGVPSAATHPFAGLQPQDQAEQEYLKNNPFEYNGARYPDLKSAFAAAQGNEVEIEVHAPFSLSETFELPSGRFLTLKGENCTITRADGFTGNMFNVSSGATLTLEEITLDGGAVWSGEKDSTLQRAITNSGTKATGSLVATAGNGKVVLNSGSILQNNDGASAVSLATRGGGFLTVNGGWIINNNAAGGGAIWGGGSITINEGSKLNGNYATSIGGAIRTVSSFGTLTMNGGEMNNNKSAGTGGAIWGGNRATYIFNGGEMAYNSATAGGAIWTGTYEKYTISGTHRMHHNSASELGGAIRFSDHASLTMTGGAVYENSSGADAFFLLNNSASITGGSIKDDFSYSGGLGLLMGEVDMEGVVHYNLATNHKTAYLASSFNSFRFTVDDSNIANFNFKPADGYAYKSGDEDKLICLNSGYEVYWDAASGTFRLKAA